MLGLLRTAYSVDDDGFFALSTYAELGADFDRARVTQNKDTIRKYVERARELGETLNKSG